MGFVEGFYLARCMDKDERLILNDVGEKVYFPRYINTKIILECGFDEEMLAVGYQICS